MKKLLSLLLCFSLLLSMAVVATFSTTAVTVDKVETSVTSGDYEYRVLSDGTAEITKYRGSDDILVVPSKLDGIVVTSLYLDSFKSGKFNTGFIEEFYERKSKEDKKG